MPLLKLGIRKGSLEEAAIELFAQAGRNITSHARNYYPRSTIRTFAVP